MNLQAVEKKVAPKKIEWSSRSELPDILNKMGLLRIGAEIGVERAHHAMDIRRRWEGKTLILIDKWEMNLNYASCGQDRHDAAFAEAMKVIGNTALAGGGRVEVLRHWSLDAAKILKERGTVLDWVYIDGDHSYEAVKNDIAAFLPLVREGGIIAGHDYLPHPDGWFRQDNWRDCYPTREAAGVTDAWPCGVNRAVNEAFAESRIALTSPDTDGGFRSWAVVV